MPFEDYQFCSVCGSGSMEKKVPCGDNRPRAVCGACGAIFYSNPKVVAGAILESGDRILLCRRGIEPRLGRWTLPAGYMENQESVVEAAAREAWEEARAKAEALYLHGVYNLIHANQVYMMYRGRLQDGEHAPGEETTDSALFDVDDIPWSELAFPVIEHAARLYLKDRERMDFRVHEGDLYRGEDGEIKFIHYS